MAIGFTLFALGYIGGGDAKLFAAVVLWLGLKDLMSYALVATVLGGVLTLALLGLRRLPLPACLPASPGSCGCMTAMPVFPMASP